MADKRQPPIINISYVEPPEPDPPFIPRWLWWLLIWIFILASLRNC